MVAGCGGFGEGSTAPPVFGVLRLGVSWGWKEEEEEEGGGAIEEEGEGGDSEFG